MRRGRCIHYLVVHTSMKNSPETNRASVFRVKKLLEIELTSLSEIRVESTSSDPTPVKYRWVLTFRHGESNHSCPLTTCRRT